MKTMINLIGEQPIPNLLPVLHLKPDHTILFYTDTTQSTERRIKGLIKNASSYRTEPYDYNAILSSIKKVVDTIEGEMIFNITGGTKMMSTVCYDIAKEKNAKIVYLQSENNNNILYLLFYDKSRNCISQNTEELGELINADYYLRAHLPAYKIEGFHREQHSKELSSGGLFEKAIADALVNNNFEVLAGIRPRGVGNQIEIDLVFRLRNTNTVAIAEVKLGDREGEGPKRGIDQLVTASEREYLGTYTKRFLITARTLNPNIKELALAHRICCIELNDYNLNGRLSEKSTKFLLDRIREKMN